MARGVRVAGLLAALALAWSPPALAQGPFSDWAAVVVAGDWRAGSGAPTEAFDNARRDIAAALERAGFSRANLRQFSVRPESDARTAPLKSDPRTIFDSLVGLTRQTNGGCLVYLTSHGLPQGVLIAKTILAPAILARMINEACQARPTIVVVSACYSGVFVRPLAAPNRMVLTAARPDRTSFGCGEDDRYPYFDQCFLQGLDRAPHFPALAEAVRTCVAAREAEEGVAPPSEPQVWVGAALRPLLPLHAFSPPPRDKEAVLEP